MAKDWIIYRNEIEALYVTHGKSLEEVRRVLKGRHNFDASIRAYRMKLEAWGVKKNRTSSRNSHPVRGRQPNWHPIATQNLPSPSLEAFLLAPTIHPSVTEGLSTSLPIHRDLFEIIESGADEELKEALSSGVSIQVQDHLNNYPLHTAVLKGNVGMTEALLQYGANVDAIGQQGKTALHLAVKSTGMLPILLQKQPNFLLQDNAGNTILHHMLLIPEWWNDLLVIKAIELVLSSGFDVNLKNRSSESPLHLLIARAVPKSLGYMKTVSGFLNAAADITTPMRNGQALFTVFLERTDILLQNSHPPYEDQDWVKAGFRCLEQFLTNGADPNIYIRTQRLVHYCLNHCVFRKGRASENFLLLLLQKADLDLVFDGNYILHMALGIANNVPKRESSFGWEFPSYSVVSALIARRIDVNQMNTFGATALETWLKKNSSSKPWRLYTQVALLLCQAGASTTITTPTGLTLFDEIKWEARTSPMELGKDMLKADVRFQLNNNSSETGTLSEWAKAWRSACKQSRWHLARVQLEKLEGASFRPRVDNFISIAYAVIAERLLEMNKAELNRWLNGDAERESVRTNYEDYGAILRDCRSKIVVDLSFWKFLVDIMHFYR